MLITRKLTPCLVSHNPPRARHVLPVVAHHKDILLEVTLHKADTLQDLNKDSSSSHHLATHSDKASRHNRATLLGVILRIHSPDNPSNQVNLSRVNGARLGHHQVTNLKEGTQVVRQQDHRGQDKGKAHHLVSSKADQTITRDPQTHGHTRAWDLTTKATCVRRGAAID